jgi:protein phosphatase
MIRDPGAEDTVELPPLASSARALWPRSDSARAQVDLAAQSHRGLVRSQNEDHYLVVRFGRMLECLLSDLPAGAIPDRSEEMGYVLLVADGIGGSVAGEQASRLAISTLLSLVLHTSDWIVSTDAQEVGRVIERLAERFRDVDAALREQGRIDAALAGMGTTLTLAASLGASVVLGHIGDSRAYLLRNGDLLQLTRDHTLLQALLDSGRISPEEAASRRFEHVLTRALGAGSARTEGEFARIWLADGDQLLLCTDGLTRMVDDATIAGILGSMLTAREVCQQLVDMALKNGGKDNVTVALARYRFPP